eukprot:TRINITY_DN72167_c0_g1_i1.p1 TRINITY_DN72167_c0_g1~~TRINITY_DN72167_c0_g1_i1.p1  ORF type:complete len:119 (-),score=2.15 TRINITY_DN72167_c0_g1_i1:16-372(-)
MSCGLADGFDACRKAGHFAGCSVFVNNAFGDATHHFRLSGAQSSQSDGLITGQDGFFNFTDKGTDARTTCFVDVCTGNGLTGAFFGLGRICHDRFPLSGLVAYMLHTAPDTPLRAGQS